MINNQRFYFYNIVLTTTAAWIDPGMSVSTGVKINLTFSCFVLFLPSNFKISPADSQRV